MIREDIMKEVENVFRRIFDDDALVLTEETNANDIEDWDSFEQINLLVAIENLLNIKFDITEVSDLKNVGQMITLIQGKMMQ